MADASVSAEGNYQYHWIGSLYTSWLNEMRDGQTDPLSKCIVATGPGGDTNVVNGRPNCTGAVYDRTPGEVAEVRPSLIPSLCARFARAGIEWRRCHHAVCMTRPCKEPRHSGQAEP